MTFHLDRSAWANAVVLGVAFFALAELSAPFVFPPFENAVVWLPGGLALGVLARGRKERWPAYLLAVVAAEALSARLHGDAWLLGIAWGIGNAVRAGVGASLMRWTAGAPVRLERMRDVISLVLFGGIVSPLLSAFIGAGSVALARGTPDFWRDLVFWFMSDAVGAVLVAPLVLTWRTGPLRRLRPAVAVEWAAIMALLIVVGQLLFGGPAGALRSWVGFASFPLLIWAAVRMGPPGAALASAVLGSIAVWHTRLGHGAFAVASETAHGQVISVEAFLALITASALLLAAAVRERRRLEQQARVLAECGATLAESLDLTLTLPRVARKVVPSSLGGLVLWRVGPEGGLERMVDEGVDAPLRERLEARAKEAPEGMLRWRDEETGALFRRLMGHERALGLMAALPRDRDAGFSSTDEEFVDALAHRFALSLDKAKLYEDAQRAIETRDEFIAIAAHELRTPLTALKLQLDRVAMQARDGNATREQARWVESLRRPLSRLTRLIDNLLDVSRLGRGSVDLVLEPTSLADIVTEVVDRHAPAAARMGCEVKLDLDENVRGVWDRARIDQLVTNLYANALKFGRGRPVEIKVSQQGEVARLTITDHGPGIQPEKLDLIFDRFEQALPARAYGGLGLGLYIARQMAEAHGGQLSVVSEPGKGATFIVELPAIPRAQKARGLPPPPQGEEAAPPS